MKTQYDIAVVGGGMVGASFALAAAREGFRVALLERTAPQLDWLPESFDLRVSALTRASQYMLENLGVWVAMRDMRVTAYDRMRVWDRQGLGEIRFAAADLGEPDLGHIVENRVIVRALWQAIEQQNGIDCLFGHDLQGVELRDGAPALRLDGERALHASLLVGADGARSRLRELAGLQLRGHAYDQHALVATVQAQRGNQSTAWQRFMPTGPLALLPMQNDLFSIVWSTSPDQAEALRQLPAEAFDTQLSAASEHCCGELSLRGERAVFPLRSQKAESYIRPGLALVGDAAHVIHPLAGQGVNLGLLDMAALLDVLLEARARGEPIGRFGVLRRYERARKGHNLAVQMAMDGFKQLFSNQNPALHLLRNLGLGVADHIPPLRRQFERVALGQGIELPSLGRLPDRD
jgi:2-polyprenylphenol 6-hydroxylase